jgi:hypothetical protein
VSKDRSVLVQLAARDKISSGRIKRLLVFLLTLPAKTFGRRIRSILADRMTGQLGNILGNFVGAGDSVKWSKSVGHLKLGIQTAQAAMAPPWAHGKFMIIPRIRGGGRAHQI